MHGDGPNWAGATDSLGRLLGVEVALPKGRSPASDRHQGEVDLHHLIQRQVRTRVPRIPTPPGALNKIAERGSAMRAPRMSAAVVVGGQDADL